VLSVTDVVASKAVNPKADNQDTTVPAGTVTPLVSLTSAAIVAGAAAVTVELVGLIVIDGESATNWTNKVLRTETPPTVAAATSVSAADVPALAAVALTVATPKPSVTAEDADRLTNPVPAAALKLTITPGATLPAASLNSARTVAAPVELRNVVALIVNETAGALPVTVKPELPCTVVVPSVAIATTSSAPDTPFVNADRRAVALPSLPVATEATLSAANVPRNVFRSTTLPAIGKPLASRTVTVTVAAFAGEIVVEERATVTAALPLELAPVTWKLAERAGSLPVLTVIVMVRIE
jgi:hypothetical protein